MKRLESNCSTRKNLRFAVFFAFETRLILSLSTRELFPPKKVELDLLVGWFGKKTHLPQIMGLMVMNSHGRTCKKSSEKQILIRTIYLPNLHLYRTSMDGKSIHRQRFLPKWWNTPCFWGISATWLNLSLLTPMDLLVKNCSPFSCIWVVSTHLRRECTSKRMNCNQNRTQDQDYPKISARLAD